MQQPGWYPSPQYPGQLQYWDGYNWTPQVKPPANSPEYSIQDPSNVLPSRPIPSFNIKSKIALRILAGFLFFMALIPLVITTPAIASNVGGHYAETSGKVISIDYSSMHSRNQINSRNNMTTRTCAPVAEYTVDGKTYTATSSIYTAPCNIHIGDVIKVKYDADNPSNGFVKESTGIMAIAWFFFIGGLIFLAGSIITFAKSFKVKEEKTQN